MNSTASRRAVVRACICGTYKSNPSQLTFTYVLGLKIHIWLVLMDFLQLQHIQVGIVIYFFAVFTIKLAILLEFLRIFFPGRSNNTFWIYHTLIWLNFLFNDIVSFLFIFPCQPTQRYGKPWIKGRCLSVIILNIAVACFNVASDLSILIVPQKVIWNLQVSLKKRAGVAVIFFAGLL